MFAIQSDSGGAMLVKQLEKKMFLDVHGTCTLRVGIAGKRWYKASTQWHCTQMESHTKLGTMYHFSSIS